VEGDTLAALTLYPLIAVAWADGRVDAKERAMALDAASRIGIVHGDLSHHLLNTWLIRKPGVLYLKEWTHYVSALAKALGPDWKHALETHIFTLCRRVARVSGSLLDLDKVSGAEFDVMTKLKEAFD
jgi:hypothetical protein